jgi:hypothetical protein
MGTLQNICFFSVFYFYCKKSTGFLQNKKKWMRIFSFILIVGLCIELVETITIFIGESLFISPDDQICTQPIFIILRSGAYLMVFVFLFIAISISKNIKKVLDGWQKQTKKANSQH